MPVALVRSSVAAIGSNEELEGNKCSILLRRKSVQVTFATRRETLNGLKIPQTEEPLNTWNYTSIAD